MNSAKSLDFGPGLEVAVRSIVGPRRQTGDENQDNFVLIDGTGRALTSIGQQDHCVQIADWPVGHVRLAVMDGLGGHGHGREATELIAQGLLHLPACAGGPTLSTGLDALHLRVRDALAGFEGRPGSTLVLLELPPSSTPWLYHVGDSRLYCVNADEATVLTVDHVPATQFAMQGLLSEAEWQQQVHAEDRSTISQAFGMGSAMEGNGVLARELLELTPDRLPPFLRHLQDRRPVNLVQDCVYLLATDGLWSFVDPLRAVARWPRILCRPDQPLDALLDDLFVDLIVASREEPSVDNATAIALRLRVALPEAEGPSQGAGA